ncbi:MAG: hypothetical protein J6I31_08070 [Prevotella sp.]|nr:hypothetical protein [Prevotella sp.]
MAQFTLIKKYRNQDTLRPIDEQQLFDLITNDTYIEEVGNFRNVFSSLLPLQREDGTLDCDSSFVNPLPRICFAQLMENRNRQRITKNYTGLVLLEVNNLPGYDEADAIRRGAAEMPQTYMAFVGADGLSVKIVCRGELFPGEQEGTLPSRQEEISLFHENLYERARLIYNGQLGVTVEKLVPKLERICYLSHDPKVYYNPMATPVYAKAEKPTRQMNLRESAQQTGDELNDEHLLSLRTAYEFMLSKAYDAAVGIHNEEEYCYVVLTKLAQYCQQANIPMAIARRMTLLHSTIAKDRPLTEKIFDNAYKRKHTKEYEERMGLRLTRHMPPETLMTMRVNIFLHENYELRKNVMRGVAEYRERTGLGFSFQDLTEEARNSITMRALEMGIRCWDKDIRRYVNSNDITLYDPLNEYLDRLPRWDGQDRVGPLADRVPTAYEEWPQLFHIWMRSMVAMWLGKGQLTGNALVPLFIGRQGCGKSSFCRIILPKELREYYNDRINFKNESDLNLGLTSFGLINLDEFDKITQRQQIVLKYLVSTPDLKYRPPYGKAYQQQRRYASFVGTTNNPTPLTDPTGSRRFICVGIDGDIDFESAIDYDQLYAQLLHEVCHGESYWLTKEQEHRLMQHNLQYQQLNGLGEMLMSLLQKPKADDKEAQWMSLKDISDMLKEHFSSYKVDEGTFIKIGSYLSRPEYRFEKKMLASGVTYRVKMRE